MMQFSRFVLLATAFALATFVAGWWAVPLVAAVYAAITTQQRSSALVSGVSAMLGWGALLAIAASRGPIGTLATELGGVLQIKPMSMYAITIAFPGLLAISAALVSRAVFSRVSAQ